MCDELRCTECYWDLTTYSLTPDGLRQEQENRLEWARDIWRELQSLKDVDEYQALIESNDDLQERLEIEVRKQHELSDTIDYLLSESTRIEARRDQLLNERQLDWRNSDPDSEIRKVKTFTADLPFKFAETIKNNVPKSERSYNRNTWLNKVIIDAAIKEGLLETSLYRIDSSCVYFAIYQKNMLYLVLSDYKLYRYTSIDWIIFKLFLNQKSKGIFLNNHQKDLFNNRECLKTFYSSEGGSIVYDFYEELEDFKVGELYSYKQTFFFIFKILESYVGEITQYEYVKRGNLTYI
jgi:hypothetical protein